MADVKLIYANPLWTIANGIRYSHNNHHLSDSYMINKDNITCPHCGEKVTTESSLIKCDKCSITMKPEYHIGYKDYNLIKRVGFKFKHESVLEFGNYIFHVECSRAVLQELARHRHQSLTVKSTRYTLKELKNEEPFYLESDWHCQTTEVGKRAAKYLNYTGVDRVDHDSILALERLRDSVSAGVSNDIVKYSLPEAYKTTLQTSFNLRSLLNLLELRLSKDALWEFREIAFQMINSLPELDKNLIFENEKIKESYQDYLSKSVVKKDDKDENDYGAFNNMMKKFTNIV